jgi:hypothetical protein
MHGPAEHLRHLANSEAGDGDAEAAIIKVHNIIRLYYNYSCFIYRFATTILVYEDNNKAFISILLFSLCFSTSLKLCCSR